MNLAALIIVVITALGFNFTIGFHDAANAIATSVSTRALRPRAALLMAAAMNLLGAFIGTGVAATVAKGLIEPPEGGHGLVVVFAALFGAIVWNLLTWRLGLPSSSSHALIGGLVGAALAASTPVKWISGVVGEFLVPTLLSPVIGFVLGYFVMVAILWIFRRANPGRAGRGFRYAQTVSAAAMALGHGLQDAQKTMGVIVLALFTTGYVSNARHVPLWVVLVTAIVLSLGTYSGGWRIMRTLGRRIIELDPPRGFAAETAASTILFVTAAMGLPISTTHTITSSIMGVGATRRLSAVRWGVANNIVAAWFLTLPGAGIVAAVGYWIAHAVTGA